ncbi:MAG: type II toxin-antitoxin system PemK/MazF family toxin [Parachlamydiaceae bacterium]|nr:type II toxin-antitoxin system PemK/MazF family toxin [Parachlamydiaceae bacterium]
MSAGAYARRGEVWLIDLGYAAKTRPCLVLSIEAEDTDRALTTVVLHTTSVRGTRFEVNLKIRFLKEGAFDTQNILSVSHAKFIRKLGSLTDEQMQQVEDAIKFWLDLL